MSGKDSQGRGHLSWVLQIDLGRGDIPTRGHSLYKDLEPGTSCKVEKRMARVVGTEGKRTKESETGVERAGLGHQGPRRACCTACVI